jgi:hypothetical protein
VRSRWGDACEGLGEIPGVHQCFRLGQGGATCATSEGAEARMREGPEEAFQAVHGTFTIASEGLGELIRKLRCCAAKRIMHERTA